VFYFLLLYSFEDNSSDNSSEGIRVVDLERKVRKVEFKVLYICREEIKMTARELHLVKGRKHERGI
jgi:hypothetical protein